jgi:hypothetical protein
LHSPLHYTVCFDSSCNGATSGLADVSHSLLTTLARLTSAMRRQEWHLLEMCHLEPLATGAWTWNTATSSMNNLDQPVRTDSGCGLICIPTPWEVRMCPFHPQIKRIVQKTIGENRADHAPNAKGNFQFDRVVTGWRGIPLLDLRHKA